MSVRVEVVDAAATRELRRAVLRPQWAPGTPMAGDTDDDAVHLAAYDDNDELVGASVILPRPRPTRPDEPDAWQLRGMVTTPDRRGAGIGGTVLHAVDREVRHRGGRLVWAHARSSARTFYEKHGFHAEGPEFVHRESGLPHFLMWREPAASTASSTQVGGPADA